MRARPRPLLLLLALLLLLGSTIAAASADAATDTLGWPQFGRTARHLNTNPDEQAFTPANVARLRVAWTDHYGDNSTSESGPVVAGGFAYIAGTDGNLSAFPAAGCGAATCEPRWQGHTDGNITSSPAVAGGLVLVGSADHLLYAFPAAGCGRAVCPPRWRGRLADAVISSSVAVTNGVAYLGDFGGHLYAFAVKGCGQAVCRPLWTGLAGPNEELTSSPAVGHGSVFIGSFINTPEEFTGRLLVFPAGGCGRALCPPRWTGVNFAAGFESSPVVAGGVVFVGKGPASGVPVDAGVYAFDARGCDGAAVCLPLSLTQLGPDQFYLGSSIAVTGGRVMLGSNDNTDGHSNLYVLNLGP